VTVDINLLREVVTVLSFASFVAIVAWAVHPKNRERFEMAALMPLDEDSPSPLGEGRGEGEWRP
jgi:cytochrome c oxidase cbb3-type subunit 4